MSSVRYLLDTSALLAHFRQELGWETVQGLFEDPEVEVLVASVSLTEFGRRLLELGANETEAGETLSGYQLLFNEVCVIDQTVARAAFVIGCKTPERLPLVDALIAAVAQMKSATLVHRDAHMRQIPSELLNQKDLAI